MKMTVNPTGKGLKPEVEKAINTIKGEDRYRYSFYVSRNLMTDYMNLCRKRKVKVNDQLSQFLERELKRYDVLT